MAFKHFTVNLSYWKAIAIFSGALAYLVEYILEILEQYNPKITPATPNSPISTSDKILLFIN